MPAQEELIGRVLAGTYRVDRLLGKGGMGAVYLATHVRLPKVRVAVKLLHAEVAQNPEIFGRFRKEAEITSELRHPNIVQVQDFNSLEDGTPYLIMEFLEGEDLHGRLRRRGRLRYEETVVLARAVGAGLWAAHKRGVVHRDLKPQNIFLCRQEQGDDVLEIPKIVDFGISKIRHTSDSQATRDQQLLGTPNYMSPEQARGQNSEVDHRTDQWALGAILYQCLTGQLAFAGDTLAAIIYKVVLEQPPALQQLAPEVPAHAVAAVQRALCKERDGRFDSILDFVRAYAGQPLTAGSTEVIEEDAAAPVEGGSVPELLTPGRKATKEFPGSSLPFAMTPPSGPTPGPQNLPSQPSQPSAPPGPPVSLGQPPPGVALRRGLIIGGVLGVLVIGGGIGALVLRPRSAEAPVPPRVPVAAPVDLAAGAPDLAAPVRPPDLALGTPAPPDLARPKKRRRHSSESELEDIDISGIK